MNGRAYSSGLQHFLSPDPALQSPANAQNHHRYAYCLNNPLRYTDPSGYIHAPAVPYNNDMDMIDDPWWSGGWASAIGRGTPLAWTTRIPSIGGFGGSMIVTRVADAGNGAYRVSSTGRYQTVDIFGAHGGYTRYISPWLGSSGPTATHFFYDLYPGASSDSWGCLPSRHYDMGGTVAGGGGSWSRGGYGGGLAGGSGGGGGLRPLDRLEAADVMEVVAQVNSTAGPYMGWGGVVGTAAERSLLASPAVDAATGVLKGVKVAGKGVGVVGEILAIGVSGYNWIKNPTAGNLVRLIVTVGIAGLNLVPIPGASLLHSHYQQWKMEDVLMVFTIG